MFLNKHQTGDNREVHLIKHSTNLEASWTPVNKLDCSLCLDVGNSRVHILRNHIATEEQAASHVFTVTRIAFHHLNNQTLI